MQYILHLIKKNDGLVEGNWCLQASCFSFTDHFTKKLLL